MWNRIQHWWQEQARKQVMQSVIAPVEPIDIIRADGLAEHDVLAQVDLLQEMSRIDAALAKELGIYQPETVNERKEIVDSLGKKMLADVIPVSFTIQGQERSSRWVVVDRSTEMHLVTLSKRDVEDFYIFVQPAQQ